MSLKGLEPAGIQLHAVDDIWDQWNQTNELSSGTNLPSSLRRRQQDIVASAGFTEVFDAEFKCLYEVPSDLVVHTPSARLNITRLVFCRNYRAGEKDSCLMGDNCKFVHADVDTRTLEAFPIHVNYIWRHEDLCTYKRLPPGEIVEVLAGNMCAVESIPSERILVTRGSLAHHDIVEPLIRCKYYDTNQTCFAGERCNYVHAIFVDPNVQGSFKRAPKAHVEIRGAENPSSLHQHQQQQQQQQHQHQHHHHHGNGINIHVSDGSNVVPSIGSNWVPNVASPPFEPGGASPFAFIQGFNGTIPCIPATVVPPQESNTWGMMSLGGATQTPALNSRPHPIPAPTPCDSSDGNLQELLKVLQLSNRTDNSNPRPQDVHPPYGAAPAQSSDASGLITQEKLADFVSYVLSLLPQQNASARNITVGSSPFLEDPYSVGTLLFLPRGVTEAVAVQPVFDVSFLGVIAALGSQQQQQQQQQQMTNLPLSCFSLGGKTQAKNWHSLSSFNSSNGGNTLISNGVMNGNVPTLFNPGAAAGAGGASSLDFYMRQLQQLQLQKASRGSV